MREKEQGTPKWVVKEQRVYEWGDIVELINDVLQDFQELLDSDDILGYDIEKKIKKWEAYK